MLSGDKLDNKVPETGNEFYIKRDKNDNEIVPKIIEDTTLGPEPTQISPEPKLLTTDRPKTTESDNNDIFQYIHKAASKATVASTPATTTKDDSLDYEIIIREGKEVITIYPETITKLLNSFAPPVAAPENLTDIVRVVSPFEQASTTVMPLWEEEVRKKYPLALDSDEDSYPEPEVETKNDKLEEMDFIKRIKDSFENQTDVEVRVSTSEAPARRWDDYVENIILPLENTQTEVNEWDDDDDIDETEDDEDDEDDDYTSSGERLSSYRKVYSR